MKDPSGRKERGIEWRKKEKEEIYVRRRDDSSLGAERVCRLGLTDGQKYRITQRFKGRGF